MSANKDNRCYISPNGNDNHDGTINSPKKTLKNGIKSTENNGTLIIGNGTYTASGIYINKNITIIGSDSSNTIINVNNGHLFTIESNCFVQIMNITIKNSKSTYGGAVDNKGYLTLIDTEFISNTAIRGGAIYNRGKLVVVNSSFDKNSAQTGGAIYNTKIISMSKTNFTNNINSSVYTEKGSTNIISLARFISNTGVNGAAIYNNGASITILNSNFLNNKVSRFGGAIYNVNGSINLRTNNFISNNASNGGGIYSTGYLYVYNHKFQQNNAKYSGACIFTYNSLDVEKSEFTSNFVNNHGGSIYSSSENQDITLKINNSKFISNTAGNAAGIYVYGKDKLTLTNSIFQSNKNRALYIKTNTVTNTIYNCNFTNNKANTNGGAIYTENSETNLNKTIFDSNIALVSGGAIYNLKGTTDIQYSLITSNNKTDIKNVNGNVTANYNWWGNNDKPSRSRQDNVTINNWAYFKVTSSSGKVGDTLTTKAALYLYTTTTQTLPNPNYLPPMTIKLTINGAGISKTYNTTSPNKSLTVNNTVTNAGKVTITGYTYNQTQVITEEITSDKPITSMFVQIGASVSSYSVNQWVNAGITDVYVQCRVSTNNVAKLKEVINLCKNTNIRVHSWIICFSTDSGFDVSASRQTTVNNFIKEVLKINGVGGICLDYVRYSGTRYGVDSTVITNYVKSVHDIVKNYNSDIQLSACVFAEKGGTKDYYGQDYAALSKYLDVELLMAYRYDYNSGRNWITDVTNYAVTKATSCKVVTVVQTYDKSINPLSQSSLEADISAAISGGSYGYSLFRYGLISSYPKDATKF